MQKNINICSPQAYSLFLLFYGRWNQYRPCCSVQEDSRPASLQTWLQETASSRTVSSSAPGSPSSMSLCPWEGWCHLQHDIFTIINLKYNTIGWFSPCKRHKDMGNLFLFLPLCMFFLSCSGLGECGLVALVSPLPPSSVCLMLSDWREGLGDGSVLLPVGLGDTWT